MPYQHRIAVAVLVGHEAYSEAQVRLCQQAFSQRAGVGNQQRGFDRRLPVDIEQNQFVSPC